MNIIFTIDAEIGEYANTQKNAFETFFEGKIDGEEVGYKYIIDKLNLHGIIGIFFVDVYLKEAILQNKIKKACQYIVNNGHSVQLHTHPSMAFDYNKPYLNQYSFKEQKEIIKLGSKLIETWTGKYPVAHRAGAYAINDNSFSALEKNNIKYDFSYFFGNKNCKIESQKTNEIFKFNNVTEIPVTVSKIKRQYKIFNLPVFSRHKWVKLDINAMTLEQIIDTITKASDNSVLVFFMHSFSFVKYEVAVKKHFVETFCLDRVAIDKFNNLLNWIDLNKELKIISISELKELV